MNEKEYTALCQKIEGAINASFEYLWNPDNLSEVHAVFFSQYDRDEYTTVYHDGHHVSKHAESLMIETTSSIGEEEVDLEFLRPEIAKCDEEQLARISSLYNVHVSDHNILAYYPVNGFYALIRAEDYDPDIFDCGALPYSF